MNMLTHLFQAAGFLTLLSLMLPGSVLSQGKSGSAENRVVHSIPVPGGGQPDSSLAGTWQGTLEVPGGSLRVVIHLRGEEGALRATLDSPDQGATGIPVGEVVHEGDSLHLKVPAILGTYDGEVGADRQAIDGTWRQSGEALPLTLRRVEEAPSPVERRRPQEPEPPYPYAAEEVRFENEVAGITLAGTLTRPEAPGPHPAVVLISGSGPQDRNETLAGHKPFLVLADYLTRHGIAVLRFDERGVGASTGSFAQATTEDFAADVAAAVAYLKQRPEIDAQRIGLIGHSEGGLVAPMVANQTGEVAFLVLMAAPGVPGEEVLYEQGARIAEAAGHGAEAVRQQRALQERLFAALKQAPDSARAAADLQAMLQKEGLNEEMAEAQARQLTAPWFRYFLTYDPAPALRRPRVPVLAVNGSKDLQVLTEQNLPAIRAALEAGGNEHYTVKELEGLNHLFQTAETGAPSEYAQIEETMAPAALEIIAAWIQEQTGGGSEQP